MAPRRASGSWLWSAVGGFGARSSAISRIVVGIVIGISELVVRIKCERWREIRHAESP
jgi:hypothetical protein